MNQLDALLLVLLVPFALRGYWRGLLRESLELAGVLGGVLAAAAGGGTLAAALVARHILPPLAARMAAVIAIFLGVYVGAALVGFVADRLARAIFLGGLNRTAGLAFGVAKGATILGMALILVQRLLRSPALDALIAASTLGAPITRFATAVVQAGSGLAASTAGNHA